MLELKSICTESLSLQIGCFLCLVGSVVIVIHAPDEQEVTDISDLNERISDPVFISYVILVIILSLILIYYFRQKYSGKGALVRDFKSII